MNTSDNDRIIGNYRTLFLEHGEGPAVAQLSAEGQRFRFGKLTQVADLSGSSILDVGCGIGDFYEFLRTRCGDIDYTGVDIVPELVQHAAQKYASATFQCTDLLELPMSRTFDYVMISGVFNNERRDAGKLLRELIAVSFGLCTKALAFNFISTRVSRIDRGMAYHDPVETLRFCLDNLSNKVTLSHHYERCDVAVFVYR